MVAGSPGGHFGALKSDNATGYVPTSHMGLVTNLPTMLAALLAHNLTREPANVHKQHRFERPNPNEPAFGRFMNINTVRRQE